jgi:hypothetical protein
MARVVVVWVAAVALLCGVAGTGLTAPHQLSEDELRGEMARNRALNAYVARNGLPDVAETRPLADRPPWDAYEVVLYYLDSRTEIRFARAAILGQPDIQIVRYDRTLTDDDAAALAARADRRGAGADEPVRALTAGPEERAEAAAQRAERAASQVEAAALTAERAAERAEAVTARMESAFHRALRK